MAEPYGQLGYIKFLIETVQKINNPLANEKRINVIEIVEL